jgi:ferredoxin
MAYIIAQPCVDVKDKALHRGMPGRLHLRRPHALHPSHRVRRLRRLRASVPVEAIYFEDDVPDQWSDYVGVKNDSFEDIGSPGGAKNLPASDHDPALVRSLAEAGTGG